MSAQPIEKTNGATVHRPRFSLVPTVRPTVSTYGFIGIIVLIIALGMGAVVVVTTSVGAQSRELTALRRQSTVLQYREASLATKLEKKSSTASLAKRATDLGMVPNPYPAYIVLPDGVILGAPTKVTGKEATFLQPARSAATATAAAKPTVTTAAQPAPTASVAPAPASSAAVAAPVATAPAPQEAP